MSLFPRPLNRPAVIGPLGWVRSVPRALADLLSRRTRCHRDHIGERLTMSDGRTFVPFRHTRKDPDRWSRDQSPAVLQPRFHLAVLGPRRRQLHRLFRVVCIVTTPFFVGLPGFRSKLWMVDPASGDFAGLYEWDDAETARSYARGLTRVLRLLSTRGSVTHAVAEGVTVEDYLRRAAADLTDGGGRPASAESSDAGEVVVNG